MQISRRFLSPYDNYFKSEPGVSRYLLCFEATNGVA